MSVSIRDWQREHIALQAFYQKRQKQDKGNVVVGTGTKAAPGWEEECLKEGATTVRGCASTQGKSGNGWRVKGWESHGVNTLPCHLKTTAVDPDKVLLVK